MKNFHFQYELLVIFEKIRLGVLSAVLSIVFDKVILHFLSAKIIYI